MGATLLMVRWKCGWGVGVMAATFGGGPWAVRQGMGALRCPTNGCVSLILIVFDVPYVSLVEVIKQFPTLQFFEASRILYVPSILVLIYASGE